MSMTAIVGALVALLPGAKSKTFDRVDKNLDKLDGLADQMQAERDQLARELEAQRNLVKHWMGEAKSLARRLRVDREMYDRLLQKEREEGRERDAFNREFVRQYAVRQQPLSERSLADNMQALQAAQAYQQTNLQQLGQQQGRLGSLGMQQQNAFQYGDWCNCVPGRHQVFEAEQRRAVTQV